jgi:hypothetical protein
MTLKKIISPVLAVAIAVGSLAPLSSAANAGDWNHRGARAGHGTSHVEHYSPRVNRWGDVRHNRWNNAGHNYNHDNGGYRRHRDHTGRNIALGAFAAILGLAIAAETAKVQHDYYDND